MLDYLGPNESFITSDELVRGFCIACVTRYSVPPGAELVAWPLRGADLVTQRREMTRLLFFRQFLFEGCRS